MVEDDSAVREMLRFVLLQNDYEVTEAGDVATAQQQILTDPPSLILLDWMLPGRSGIDFSLELKRDKRTSAIPVVMVTARGEESDKVRALETGADDYVTKPFSPRELVARIRAVIRRSAPHHNEEPVTAGKVYLDPSAHEVSVNGQRVDLGPTEFKLLHFFMTHQDRVYRRSHLLDLVWGQNAFIEERTVDVYVRRLRGALEPFGIEDMLQTVRGVGYRYSAKT